MKCTSTFALSLAAVFLSPFTDAIALHRRTDGPPRVVGLPIQREPVTDPLVRDRSRMHKRGTLEVTLNNEQTLYLANITLGTPAQSFRLHIDTGSSDLWVNSADSTFCTAKNETAMSECEVSGTYAANSSSTYHYVGSGFNISYLDGSGASGDYATDTLSIAGTKIKDLQFGVGYHSSSAEGVLGIGFQKNEVQVSRLKEKPYNNIPAAMADQGVIASNAYSLWLNDLDANTGNILFGGVDTERFTGNLATLPVEKMNGEYTDFLITLTNISSNGQAIADGQAQAVILDSGSSLTYLPNAMTSAIYESIDAQYDSDIGAAFVPCSLKYNNNSTLDFTFTSPTISVPMDELILDITSMAGQPVNFPNGVPACLFGIAPAGVSTPVLGDTFLRSAYVVYDLANNQISLAQTRYNATKSNVVEIGKGTNAVPEATAVVNPVVATAGVGSGAARIMGVSAPAAGLCGLVAVVIGLC